jgi:hypothetical protein
MPVIPKTERLRHRIKNSRPACAIYQEAVSKEFQNRGSTNAKKHFLGKVH